MLDFLFKNGELIGMIVGVSVALNLIVAGLRKLLAIFKDKTESDADNKAFDILGKIKGVLEKIISTFKKNEEVISAAKKVVKKPVKRSRKKPVGRPRKNAKK